MPRLSRWAIRSSFLYMVAGLAAGTVLLVHKGLGLNPQLWRLLPLHIEFLLLGWMLQLVLGVAYWILPRFPDPPVRGRVRTAWTAFTLLNAGVLLAGLAPTLAAGTTLRAAGRALELGAALAFAFHAWPRIKPTRPAEAA